MPSQDIVESICAGFLLEYRALECALNQTRRDRAKEKRAQDPNAVYRDVAKQKALPVQTVVAKRVVAIQSISSDHKTLRYEPGMLDLQEPVYSEFGLLQPTQHTSGELQFAEEQILLSGSLLTQERSVGAVTEVFEEFRKLWSPMWNRHVDTPVERWDAFVHMLDQHVPPPAQLMPWEPITLEDWDATVKLKKARSAPGPDGVTRQDLQHMPLAFREKLVQYLQAIEAGEMAWPHEILEGQVALVEKHSLASTTGEFRPITVLGMIYRTWGTYRARQIIRWVS